MVALLAPLALWVGWCDFSIGLASFWADSDPDSALRWRPDDANALVAAADLAVIAKDFTRADQLARQALSAYPLDGRGYRVLAQERQFFRDDAAVSRLANIALDRSPRDVPARMLLLDQAAKRNDLSAALAQIDVVLRIRPDLAPVLLPRLVAASSIPAFAKLVGHSLITRPPWRLAFLQSLANSGTDPEAIDRVFAERGSDDPLPPPLLGSESDLLIRRQISDGRWGAAYFTWYSTLSVAQRTRTGNVFDGSFDFPPSNEGFDWRLPQQGTGFDVSIGPAGDMNADNSLQVHFNGLPLDYRPVRQLLILGPGHYRFTTMGGADGLDTQEGGLAWTLTCAEGDGQALAATDFLSGDSPLALLKMEFDVPATGCSAQWLRLDLSEGDFKGQPLHGNAVFDNVKIERIDGAGNNSAASTNDAGLPSGGATPTASGKRDGTTSSMPSALNDPNP